MLLTLAAVLAATVVAAQPGAPAAGSHGTVAGTVTLTDARGEKFDAPDVQISLACAGTTAEPLVAASDARGSFRFADVRPGRCSLSADLQGFRRVTASVMVHRAEMLQVAIHLDVAPVDAGFLVIAKSTSSWRTRRFH